MPEVKKINTDIKSKNHRKIIILTAAVIILISLTLIYMFKGPYYSRIDMTVTALMVSEENTDVKEVKIIIKGEYVRYIIPNDYYRGKFIINGFNTTEWLEHTNFYLGKKVLSYMMYTNRGNIVVQEYQNSLFGSIIADKKFKSFVIIPYEDSLEDPSYYGYHGGMGFNEDKITVIVYPADTREGAVALANEKLTACFGEDFKPMK